MDDEQAAMPQTPDPEDGAFVNERGRAACVFASRSVARDGATDLATSGFPLAAIQIVEQHEPPQEPAGGGLWHSVRGLFPGDADARRYYEGIDQGDVLVTVQARSDAEAQHAATILEQHDAADGAPPAEQPCKPY